VAAPSTFGTEGDGVPAPGCTATSGWTTGVGGGSGGGGGGELLSFVVVEPPVLVCVVEELEVELDVALPVVIEAELLPVDAIETIGFASCASAWCTAALVFDGSVARPELTLLVPELGGGHALAGGAGAGSTGPVGGVVVVPSGGVDRGAGSGGVVLGLAILASPPPPTSLISEAPATPRESDSASAAAPPVAMRRRRRSRRVTAASMRSAIPVDGE
jgi:hypothetical protein